MRRTRAATSLRVGHRVASRGVSDATSGLIIDWPCTGHDGYRPGTGVRPAFLPGDSVVSVTDHVPGIINDSRVDIKVAGRFSSDPSAVSSADSDSFRTLERTIQTLNPDAIVTPYLVVVVTDARYYAALSRNIFRFLPVRLTPEDLQRVHGSNERLTIEQSEDAIRTYRQLILNAAIGEWRDQVANFHLSAGRQSSRP